MPDKANDQKSYSKRNSLGKQDGVRNLKRLYPETKNVNELLSTESKYLIRISEFSKFLELIANDELKKIDSEFYESVLQYKKAINLIKVVSTKIVNEIKDDKSSGIILEVFAKKFSEHEKELCNSYALCVELNGLLADNNNKKVLKYMRRKYKEISQEKLDEDGMLKKLQSLEIEAIQRIPRYALFSDGFEKIEGELPGHVLDSFKREYEKIIKHMNNRYLLPEIYSKAKIELATYLHGNSHQNKILNKVINMMENDQIDEETKVKFFKADEVKIAFYLLRQGAEQKGYEPIVKFIDNLGLVDNVKVTQAQIDNKQDIYNEVIAKLDRINNNLPQEPDILQAVTKPNNSDTGLGVFDQHNSASTLKDKLIDKGGFKANNDILGEQHCSLKKEFIKNNNYETGEVKLNENSQEIYIDGNYKEADITAFAHAVMAVATPAEPMYINSGEPKAIIEALEIIQQEQKTVVLLLADNLKQSMEDFKINNPDYEAKIEELVKYEQDGANPSARLNF